DDLFETTGVGREGVRDLEDPHDALPSPPRVIHRHAHSTHSAPSAWAANQLQPTATIPQRGIVTHAPATTTTSIAVLSHSAAPRRPVARRIATATLVTASGTADRVSTTSRTAPASR